MDVISLVEYHLIEESLRSKGFMQSLNDNVICRWNINNMIVDVMPTDEKILGFSNRWYKLAAINAVTHQLDNGVSIRVVSAPYFLATKLEAFKGRGQNDFMGSHDLEDIVAVIDGRAEITDEILKSDASLRKYLSQSFNELGSHRDFHDSLPGHLNYGSVLDERLGMVLDRIDAICNI